MLCAPLDNEQSPPDELYLERFEAFMEKCLTDIHSFAEREARSFEQVHKDFQSFYVCFLLIPVYRRDETLLGGIVISFSNGSPHPHRLKFPTGLPKVGFLVPDKWMAFSLYVVWTILVNLSRILESLSGVFGIESFLLAVDPEDITSQSFLGGTITGREFWRGMRAGGESGAKAFKEQCTKNKGSKNVAHSVAHNQHLLSGNSSKSISPSSVINVSSKQSAKNVKVELYEGVRNALR